MDNNYNNWNAIKSLKSYINHNFLYNNYIVSYPKCGRTWLASLLEHYILRIYYNISAPETYKYNPNLLKLTWWRQFPNICMTHDISTDDIDFKTLKKTFDNNLYQKKKTVFLSRDPRDVIISYYHHSKKKSYKNNLPKNISLSEFIRLENKYGIKRIIDYFNLWAPYIRKSDNVILCKYEDLLIDTVNNLRIILDFFNVKNIKIDEVKWSVSQNNFNKMQKREREKKAKGDNSQLRTRNGTSGKFKEEMSLQDVEFVNKITNDNLDKLYGYY